MNNMTDNDLPENLEKEEEEIPEDSNENEQEHKLNELADFLGLAQNTTD
jgi:hypothetical protein